LHKFLILPMRATYPTHLILLDLLTLQVQVQVTKLPIFTIFSSLPPLPPS
jgi:hypothetical protein